ncbi:MAG: hypothetical protein L0Y66_03335 [Myxococcaceae bacterium]|nr:hypothetical protein [Myxococcaceae bacterium]
MASLMRGAHFQRPSQTRGFWRRVRRLLPLASLLAAPALAHQPDFAFLTPTGIGHVREGGPVELGWRGTDSQGTRQVQLFASRLAVSEWRRPDPALDTPITTEPLALATAPPHYAWDTTGLPPGCYQPYAAVREVTEDWYFVVPGKVTVRTPTFVPPSVWITNAPGEELDAFGHFVIRFQVHDPDSATTVSLKYGDGVSLYDIAEGLPVPAGGGEGSFEFDATGLRNGYFELYARVDAPGEPSCETFWSDVLYVEGGGYAVPDAGVADAGQQEPPPPLKEWPEDAGGARPSALVEPTGCAASPGTFLVSGLVALAHAWRRARAATRSARRAHRGRPPS